MIRAKDLATELAAGPTLAFGEVKSLLNASPTTGSKPRWMESRAISRMSGPPTGPKASPRSSRNAALISKG